MNIVIIAGSNQKISTSTRLAEYVGKLLTEQEHQVHLFDLYRSPVPIYSPDESYDDHNHLNKLKRLLIDADGIILATPEYHGGMTGVLKNALDHLGQEHFDEKPVLSMASSGGAVAVSSLQQLHSAVRNLHGINSSEWISIGGSQRKWFTGDQPITEVGEDVDARIQRVLKSFVRLCGLK